MHANLGAAFLGLLAVLSVAAAIFVYSGRPRHPTNRLLALALFFQALTETAVAARLLHDLPMRLGGSLLGTQVVFFVGAISGVMLYLLFLGTLRTPLARPIGTRMARGAILAYWGILCAWVIVRPQDVLHADEAPPSLTLIVPVILVSIYGLLVAIQMFRRSDPAGLERRQATAFLLAFGIRDLGFLVFGAAAVTAGSVPFSDSAEWVVRRIPSVINFLSALFLTYGILTTQLFDIDLKIKWTLSRGTVAAVFVSAFFIVSELVAGLLSDRIGLVAGVLVTGLLMFALAPLQRLGDQISDAAMPHVKDTPEYRTVRRTQLYEAALRSALRDGIVTDRERDMLATLADELGLSSVEVVSLERRVQEAVGTVL